MGKGFGGGMPDMGDLMKYAKKMQTDMQKVQGGLKDKVVEGSAGGQVKVFINGKREVVRVEIAKEAVDPDDIEMLEDLVTAATNQALKKVEEMVQHEMGKVSGGVDISKLGNLFGI